jgi:glycosyltransferase involved in cell wall biosynthesis
MKILRIIARLNVGGPARHVVWLTEGLQPYGYETLLVAGVVPPGEDDMSYVAAAAGVRPFTLPQMSRAISLKDALTIWKLFRLMRIERPDIVHTYHGHVFHSYYGKFKTRLFLAIERFLARFATDRIVVISEQQRREINETFRVGRREQFAVIPLGIDLGDYAAWRDRRPRLRSELKLKDDEVLIGIVGRATEIKNHCLFLEAAALSKKTFGSKIHFAIIGDGNLRRDLEAQAKSLGLENDVSFLGMRNNPEDFYPALDIVALTSLNEGTPLTLIEAMANARPVVATAVGGVPDLLGAPTQVDEAPGYQICERGISVASGDAEGFARGLTRLIADPQLRDDLGRAGLEFVTDKYAKERLLRDMAELYRGLTQAESIDLTASPKERVASRF